MEEFVKVDQVVAFAASMIPKCTPEERDIFRSWAWLALKRLPQPQMNIIDVMVKPKDGMFKKPIGFARLEQFALFDAEEKELFSKLMHRGKRIKKNYYNDETYGKSAIEVHEDRFSFQVSSDDAEIVDHMWMKYWGYQVDEKNEPLIPNLYEECIVNYIVWRANQARGMNDPNLKMDWMQEEARVKAKTKMPTHQQADQIMRDWVSMIPNFNNRY